MRELEEGLNSYREQLRMRLLAAHIADLRVEADGMSGKVQQLRGTLENRELALRALEQQRSACWTRHSIRPTTSSRRWQ